MTPETKIARPTSEPKTIASNAPILNSEEVSDRTGSVEGIEA